MAANGTAPAGQTSLCLGRVLAKTAAAKADATALLFEGSAYTYSELDAAAAGFAAWLHANGIAPGSRLTLHLPNGPEWIAVFHGAARAGVVINPVNILNTAEEVAYIADDCGAQVLVADADKAAAIQRLSSNGSSRRVISPGDRPLLSAGLDRIRGSVGDDARAVHEAAADDLAVIGYTSGTTGRPKGAMMSNQAVVLNACLTATLHGRNASDRVISALPLPHVYGLSVLNAGIIAGACLVLHARFDAEAMIGSIEETGATLLDAVPTMYMYMLASPDCRPDKMASLTRCTVGGQTMPLAQMQEVEARFGCRLIELWGMTELSGLGTTHPLHGLPALGSIGIPLPYCRARIARLANEAEAAEPGEAGELLFHGPLVTKGYYNNLAATEAAITPDGWLRTGDIAVMDDLGRITIVDRKKEMILTGGYNVYPAEIERVLAQHPAVAMVAVGKVPDVQKGELAKAYVVLKPGMDAQPDALIAHCRDHLAAYKVPRAIQCVADLPKTSTGKVLRRELHRLDAPEGDRA